MLMLKPGLVPVSGRIYLVVGTLGANSMTGSPGNTIECVMGMPFLERFYAVFDTAHSQVGLAYTSFTNAISNSQAGIWNTRYVEVHRTSVVVFSPLFIPRMILYSTTYELYYISWKIFIFRIFIFPSGLVWFGTWFWTIHIIWSCRNGTGNISARKKNTKHMWVWEKMQI